MQLLHGDTIEHMKNLSDNSVDLILTDLPYGTTRNKWDVIIPFDELWEQYNRVIKDNGAIILFGQGLFSAKLIMSNESMYRYSLVWDKILTTGFLNANRMPLRSHEDIIVFYKKLPTYHPQKFKGAPNHGVGKSVGKIPTTNNNYGNMITTDSDKSGMKYPKSILTFQKDHPSTTVHPTQKPLALLEYLIKTYSNTGDVVLDNTMGSGSTGVACVNTGREFIGIELDDEYFEIAENRIKEAIETKENQ